MRQIFWIILIVCVVIFGAIWYSNRSKTRAVNSGEVHVRDQQGDAPGATSPVPTIGADQAQQQPQQQPAVEGQADGGVAVPPVSDSIQRNPPNGMLFAGTGKYQLYRQGDITWRLNTDSGEACILFATDAEWKKPRVFQYGCAGH